MFEFTESIRVDAKPDVVWEFMRDVERWWLPSNPEHVSLERLDGGELGLGSRLRIRERIAGVPGEATGEITSFQAGAEVTWEAANAHYRLAGVGVTLSEGVAWRLRSFGSGTEVSAHVWARFPPGLLGQILELVFRLANGVEKDREHARTELRYLKRIIEGSEAA